jgi:hypothetical protein
MRWDPEVAVRAAITSMRSDTSPSEDEEQLRRRETRHKLRMAALAKKRGSES